MNNEAPSVNIGLRLRSLWALVHPGPSLATAAAYAIFAIIAAHGRPNPETLAVTTAGMVAMQFAISVFNDYCDREADKNSHKFKPIARGILPAWLAAVMTISLAGLVIVCFAPFGGAPLLIASAALGLGFAYDLGLKSTLLGAVLLGLAFPLLPLLAWSIFAHITPALYWTFPLGLAMGASIHIADALPDLADDRKVGSGALALALGAAAQRVQWILLAGANVFVIILAIARMTSVRPVALGVTTGIVCALIAASLISSQQHGWPAPHRLRVNFILTVLTALVIAVGWVISALM